MYNYSEIKNIHIELTQHCQANCPMCDRNMNGDGINPHLSLCELTLQDCKYMFKEDFIGQLDSILLCGNHGDPILAPDMLEILQYFRKCNPSVWIGVNTNGAVRSTQWWADVAKAIGKHGAVTFSIDGLSDTNHIYRQNVQWDILENNFRSFIAAGGRAKWDFLIFDHNQHQVELANEISIAEGFEKFIPKKTGRFITSSAAPKQNHTIQNNNVQLHKPKEKFQNNALKVQDKIIDQFGSMDHYADATIIQCKVLKNYDVYISAEGLVLPCCWTAGRMYKWWNKDPKVEQIWRIIESVGGKDAINAKLHGLEAIFDTDLFTNIKKSWDLPSIKAGKLKVCAMKCGTEFDPFTEQFK